MKYWYAVQKHITDRLDKGSHDWHEAAEMLREQKGGLVLTIDEETGKMVTVTYYGDIFKICAVCGKEMSDGFWVDGEHYCSEDCLYQEYTPEEYKEMYENDEAYWTDWLC